MADYEGAEYGNSLYDEELNHVDLINKLIYNQIEGTTERKVIVGIYNRGKNEVELIIIDVLEALKNYKNYSLVDIMFRGNIAYPIVEKK